MSNFLLPALILAMTGVIGISIWLAVVLSRSRRKEKTLGEPRGQPTLAGDTDDIVRIRKNARGVWEVWVRGALYSSLSDVPDPEERQEVINALRILAGFSREVIARQKKKAAKPEPAPTAAPSPSSPTPPPPSGLTSPQERLHRPGMPSLMPEINLAKEVNEILEVLQGQRPELAERSIRLQNTPDGGVRFWVDNQVYESVAEIPDSDVQALIRAATKEWERR
jgi:hypothetical protein